MYGDIDHEDPLTSREKRDPEDEPRRAGILTGLFKSVGYMVLMVAGYVVLVTVWDAVWVVFTNITFMGGAR